MARRTKEAAQEPRAHLLDAAERVFSEKGVTSTSMNEIAVAAGVTRGALYHHFKNKLDLVGALMERVMMPINEMRLCAAVTAPEKPQNQNHQHTKHNEQHTNKEPHTRAVFTILFHKCEYVDTVLPIKHRHVQTRNECADEVASAFAAALAAGH